MTRNDYETTMVNLKREKHNRNHYFDLLKDLIPQIESSSNDALLKLLGPQIYLHKYIGIDLAPSCK